MLTSTTPGGYDKAIKKKPGSWGLLYNESALLKGISCDELAVLHAIGG